MKVWVLIREEDFYDHLWYIIGVFSSYEKAKNHFEQLENKPNEYAIEEYEIDKEDV